MASKQSKWTGRRKRKWKGKQQKKKGKGNTKKRYTVQDVCFFFKKDRIKSHFLAFKLLFFLNNLWNEENYDINRQK